MSSGATARLVERFGARQTLIGGIASAVAGLALFSLAGESTSYFSVMFAALAMIGIGFGAAMPPLMVIAMEDVLAADAGLASGTIQVSIQLSAAIGLAALGTVATDRTHALASAGESATQALSGGYHLAFLIAASVAAIGVAIALLILRSPRGQEEVAELEAPAQVELQAAA
jgi:MFS family permease